MASRQLPDRRRRGGGGLIGKAIGVIGTGVGAATEYHQHRKQRKAAHEASLSPPATDDAAAGPSSRPEAGSRSISDGAPPAYDASDRRLDSGPPVSGDKKAALDDDDSDTDSSDSDLETPIAEDEEAWELDEVAAATEPPSYEQAIGEDTSEDALVRDTLVNRRDIKAHGPLQLPVILPQRRPRNKSRGFVRAYSPVLEDVGIDQETFLKFLKNFHKSSQANPTWTAITIAAGIVGFVPGITTMAVSTSVQIVAGVGKAINANRNTNKFLDRMNEELFKPAGCYAMIVKYKSDAEVAKAGNSLFARLGIGAEQVDFNTTRAVARYDIPSPAAESGPGTATPNGLAEQLKKIRLVSGTTRGSTQMLEAAPLIYPEIDSVIYSGKAGEETFKDRAKDAGKFMASYMDRRSQIKYAQQDPNSKLNVPESERGFQSKHADPNHPMYNNGLVGLLSGGKLTPRDRKFDRRASRDADRFDRRESRHALRMARHERRLERRYGPYLSDEQYAAEMQRREAKHERKMERKYGPRVLNNAPASAGVAAPPAEAAPYGSSSAAYGGRGDYFARGEPGLGGRAGRRNGQKGGVIGMVKKVMQEDVLYLMIVPMPSEEELAEARAAMAAAKAK